MATESDPTVTRSGAVASDDVPPDSGSKHSRKKGPGSLLRILSWVVIGAGALLIIAGTVTWFTVKSELSDEKITVSDDADRFAGDKVDGPLTAYSEAETIQKHALEEGGGKTYAELDQDDPLRETAATASYLRTSLFTSIVAFGVALLAAGTGVIAIIYGWSLLALGRRPV